MLYFFFFNDTATTEIYTLSLHDALPICQTEQAKPAPVRVVFAFAPRDAAVVVSALGRARRVRVVVRLRRRRNKRSEEHTSELQSRQYLVCRLLLEKKKKN